jgi:hypothetical protein
MSYGKKTGDLVVTQGGKRNFNPSDVQVFVPQKNEHQRRKRDKALTNVR